MTDKSHITKQPSPESGGIAILVVFCAAGLSTSHPLQVSIVGVEAMGAFLLLGGWVVRDREGRGSGYVFYLAGSLLVSLALGMSVVFPGEPIERAALVAGTVGPAIVLLAVSPLCTSCSHSLTGLGTSLLMGGVMIRGWLEQIGQLHVFVAVVMTILAWDTAEQAITLGNDVGRDARTVLVTITHTVGTLSIGAFAILVTAGVYGVTPATIPVVGLALLFVSIPLLLLAVYSSYVS